MSDQPPRRLSSDELLALKAAAHRQLARWSQKATLSPHQRERRAALVRAVRVLQDKAFLHGCELHAPSEDADA